MVYISKGDGTFVSGVSYNMGASSAGQSILNVGDFNGDSKTDVAISIAGDNVAGAEIVFLGNGDGTLQTTPKTSGGVVFPDYATIGDFNGDGKLDLVVSAGAVCNGTCTVPAETSLFVGNGDGTFQAPAVVFAGVGQVIAADVNGDGKLDVILEQFQPAVGRIYLGAGNGTFTDSNNYILNFTADMSFVATGDFNSDGKVDIAMGNAVLIGKG